MEMHIIQKITLILIFAILLFIIVTKIKNKYIKVNIDQIEILTEYKNTFRGYDIPKTLVKLAEFNNSAGGESYSESFSLRAEKDIFNYWLDSSSTSIEQIETYANRMIVFANADGTGGFYAFWAKNKNSDLEESPIVAYGSEGAVKIVANNLKGLIRILSYGAEGMDGNYGLSGYDSYEEFLQYRPNFLKFRNWMKDELKIEPIKNWKVPESYEVNTIISDANKKHKSEFDVWQYQFYKSPEELKKEYEAQEKIETKKLEFKKAEVLLQIGQGATVELYFELVQNERYYPKKIEYLKEALKLDENNTDVLYALGNLSRDDNALAYYHKVEKLLPSPITTELYYKFALIYDRDNKNIEALKYFKQHIQLNPRPNRYGDSDLIALCKKLKIDPISIYEKAVKVAKNKSNYETLHDLYLEKKEYENAMHSLQRLFKVTTPEEYEYSIWGDEFLENGYEEYALEIFKEGTKKLPDPWDKASLYKKVIEVYKKFEDLDKVEEYQNLALKYFKKNLEVEKENPSKIRLSEEIADIYDDQNKILLYIEYIQKALDYEEDNLNKSHFLFYIAQAYKKLRQYDKARYYAKKSYEIDNDETVSDFINVLKNSDF